MRRVTIARDRVYDIRGMIRRPGSIRVDQRSNGALVDLLFEGDQPVTISAKQAAELRRALQFIEEGIAP